MWRTWILDISLYFAQEALCCKSLKLDHVMQVVVRTVNFVRTITVSLTAFSVIRHFLFTWGNWKLYVQIWFSDKHKLFYYSYKNSWKLSILITRVLYSDYIGPARLRLNLPELAPELKRVWHSWFNVSLVFHSRSFQQNEILYKLH